MRGFIRPGYNPNFVSKNLVMKLNSSDPVRGVFSTQGYNCNIIAMYLTCFYLCQILCNLSLFAPQVKPCIIMHNSGKKYLVRPNSILEIKCTPFFYTKFNLQSSLSWPVSGYYLWHMIDTFIKLMNDQGKNNTYLLIQSGYNECE